MYIETVVYLLQKGLSANGRTKNTVVFQSLRLKGAHWSSLNKRFPKMYPLMTVKAFQQDLEQSDKENKLPLPWSAEYWPRLKVSISTSKIQTKSVKTHIQKEKHFSWVYSTAWVQLIPDNIKLTTQNIHHAYFLQLTDHKNKND